MDDEPGILVQSGWHEGEPSVRMKLSNEGEVTNAVLTPEGAKILGESLIEAANEAMKLVVSSSVRN